MEMTLSLGVDPASVVVLKIDANYNDVTQIPPPKGRLVTGLLRIVMSSHGQWVSIFPILNDEQMTNQVSKINPRKFN